MSNSFLFGRVEPNPNWEETPFGEGDSIEDVMEAYYRDENETIETYDIDSIKNDELRDLFVKAFNAWDRLVCAKQNIDVFFEEYQNEKDDYEAAKAGYGEGVFG